MSEMACDQMPAMKDGKEKYSLRFEFACTIKHVSGSCGDIEPITVILPFVGAQTTGQARSYALKEYLKSAFLASSGDSEDADAHDEMETLSKQEARPLFRELQAELRQAAKHGREAMKTWVGNRKPSISVMPKDWQILLRKEYQEGLATGTLKRAEPEENSDPFDPELFLAEIEESIAKAKSEDALTEAWDALDVEASLTDHEDVLQRAFNLRKDMLKNIEQAANLMAG